MTLKQNQYGFTLMELLLSIGIASVLTTVLLSISLTFFGDTMRSNYTAELAVESHYAMRAIVEDIRLAKSIAPSNIIADPNRSGGWLTSDASNVFVINSPATDSVHNVIYDNTTGYPYDNEIVYFLSGSKLYKRSLKNTSAPGNAITTSCPQAQVSATCPADKTFHSHLNDISFVLYDTNNLVTTDPTLARSVKITLNASRKSFGKTITFTDTLQTTLRNQ